MNVFSAIGRIGKDAVVRVTTSGTSVTGWSVAVDSGFGDKKQTLWFDCALWGERGTKIATYIKKGDRIGVTGEIGTREHEGKTYHTLNVQNVTLLGAKGGESAKPAAANSGASAADPSDEIPF
jgi:single-strand DNA-binding protein